jgi:hypothetical protein
LKPIERSTRRLKAEDLPIRLHARRSDQRIEPGVCSNVDEDVASPEEVKNKPSLAILEVPSKDSQGQDAIGVKAHISSRRNAHHDELALRL